MAATGFVQIGVELGLDAILVKPQRSIGPFVAQVTVREEHEDELQITEQPVEQGAAITDHAFKRPARLVITAGWSNSPGSSSLLGSIASAVTGTVDGISSLLTGNDISQVRDIYDRFLALQELREPFTVFTGKRVYDNMLIRSLGTITDKESENSLTLVIRLQQIIIVKQATTASSVTASSEDQQDPGITEPTSDEGTKQLSPPADADANEQEVLQYSKAGA